MANAVVDDITSEATGYPKENLLDANPDTYWKPSSTAAQYIKFDLQAAYAIGAICLFVNDYKTLTSNGGVTVRVYAYYADTDLSLTDGGWTIISNPAYTTIGSMASGPLRIAELTGAPSHRYWRLYITAQNEAVKISGVWFCYKRSIATGNQWPEADKHTYANRSVALNGGRRFVSAINKSPYVSLERTFLFVDSTNFGILQNAFLDSCGSRHPVIFQEGSTYDTARLVYFDEEVFNDNQTDYQIYNPTVRMSELPYIHDGDTY